MQLFYVAAVISAVLAVAIVFWRDPNQAGNYPSCPFYAATGYYCAGCGSMRATHALSHGQLGLAFAQNPLLVLSLPLLAVSFVVWTRRVWFGLLPKRRLAPNVIYGIFVLFVAYWILRNVPLWPFSSLAPGSP